MAAKTRSADKLDLQVATPADADTEPGPGPFAAVVHPWIVAGVVGALAVALSGWIVTTLWVIIGWATEVDGPFVGVLAFGSRVWLAGMGTGLKLGTTLVTVVPLGMTLLTGIGIAVTSFFAARTARGQDDSVPVGALRVTWQTSVAATVTYVIVVTAMAVAFVEATQAARGMGTAAVVAGCASWLGAARGARWQPSHAWPWWARRLPAVLGIGIAGLTLLSAIALLTATVANWPRVNRIAEALALGPIESGVLVVGQLAFLPNALLWAGSYALGAGFTIGTGSAVTVSSATVGLLPAFPIFGLIPEPGATGGAQPAWLVGGAVVGLIVGAVMLAGWTSGRDRTQTLALAGLIGGAVGAGTALVWAAITSVSRGSLGTGRLVELGPRMLELVAISAGLLGIPAAAAAIAVVALSTHLPAGGVAWLDKIVAKLAPEPAVVTPPADADEDRTVELAGATRPT